MDERDPQVKLEHTSREALKDPVDVSHHRDVHAGDEQGLGQEHPDHGQSAKEGQPLQRHAADPLRDHRVLCGLAARSRVQEG